MARAQIKTPPPISFRVTEDERERLEKAASGLSLSAYIRQCVFGEHTASRKVRNRAPIKDHAALARVLGLLGNSRIANNLNQLAKDANCGALRLDRETEAKITEAYSHVIAMRQELIRALGLLEGDQ
jgi:hypothetical protein